LLAAGVAAELGALAPLVAPVASLLFAGVAVLDAVAGAAQCVLSTDMFLSSMALRDFSMALSAADDDAPA